MVCWCWYRGGAEYKQTCDGIEDKFAVNHLGPFLFTNLIMDRILRAGEGARIVNVSSRGHRRSGIRWDDWNFSVSTLQLCQFPQRKKGMDGANVSF
jgi:NAD(P)-dependent dehydrogenase (short-subunit alcohol dehydrogenase family)